MWEVIGGLHKHQSSVWIEVSFGLHFGGNEWSEADSNMEKKPCHNLFACSEIDERLG